MFLLKGKYLETTSYFSKKENKTINQAVIYSDGDGVTYKLSDLDTRDYKPFQSVEIPVTVGVYDGKLFLRPISTK